MYQALYRKYRPQTFDDVVGQRSITETLKNQLITGRLSHAYLFTGTRGTGKTSCTKIGRQPLQLLRRLPEHRFRRLYGRSGNRRRLQ